MFWRAGTVPVVRSAGWGRAKGARMDWVNPPGGMMESSVGVGTATPMLVACEERSSGAVAMRPRRCGTIGSTGISVIIVNYCQWGNTQRLVRQLRDCAAWARGQVRVVVVDNGSGERRWIEADDGLKIRREHRNVGFAAGVNRGVAELQRWVWGIWRSGANAVSEWYLLLNPDVTVAAGFLDEVVRLAEETGREQPRAGVIGLRLCNRDGSLQGSCGHFPTLRSTLFGLLRPRAWRKCVALETNQRQQVDWVTGGCLLVRRDCYEELGGLDESFFLYYEDVDFCRRAKAAGWQVWYEPRVAVTHHWPLHARPVPAPLRLMTRHALLRYASKHWDRRSTWQLRWLMWWESWCREVWSRLRRERAAVDCYRQWRRLMRAMQAGQERQVRRRLMQVSRQLRVVSAAQDLQELAEG